MAEYAKSKVSLPGKTEQLLRQTIEKIKNQLRYDPPDNVDELIRENILKFLTEHFAKINRDDLILFQVARISELKDILNTQDNYSEENEILYKRIGGYESTNHVLTDFLVKKGKINWDQPLEDNIIEYIDSLSKEAHDGN